MSALEHRVKELEIRIMHQDKTIADLNEMITAQWKQLEVMERQLRRLNEELEAMGSGDAPAANQKPPHY
jgi:SlyX protein